MSGELCFLSYCHREDYLRSIDISEASQSQPSSPSWAADWTTDISDMEPKG
jgi:hypothetical protein